MRDRRRAGREPSRAWWLYVLAAAAVPVGVYLVILLAALGQRCG
jgi:hypothetical protein